MLNKEKITQMKTLYNLLMSTDIEIRLPAIMTALDYTLAEMDITIEDVLKVRDEVNEICGEVGDN